MADPQKIQKQHITAPRHSEGYRFSFLLAERLRMEKCLVTNPHFGRLVPYLITENGINMNIPIYLVVEKARKEYCSMMFDVFHHWG